MINNDVRDFDILDEKHYIIGFNYYTNFRYNYLYDTNTENKYYHLHTVFFSFIGSSFEYDINKINCVNILKVFLIFTKSDLHEKIGLFLYFSIKKINYHDLGNSLKAILIDYLKYILREITYEMMKIVLNEEKSLKVNLSSINVLFEAYKEANIIKFIDFILLNASFEINLSVDKEALNKELTEFLISKPFLFNFISLRNLFLSV